MNAIKPEGSRARRISALVTGLIIVLIGTGAAANEAVSKWIHSLVQEGQSVRITIQIFDEVDEEELVYDTFDFPGFDDQYSLIRFGAGPQETVADGLVFDPAQAVEVTDFVCHTGEESLAECTEPCVGVCAVAHRYEIVDDCVPVGLQYYQLTIPAIANDPTYHDEGLGTQTIDVEDYAGDSCFDDDTGVCAVTAVGRQAPPGLVSLAAFLLGLSFVLVRRWR